MAGMEFSLFYIWVGVYAFLMILQNLHLLKSIVQFLDPYLTPKELDEMGMGENVVFLLSYMGIRCLHICKYVLSSISDGLFNVFNQVGF